MHLIDVAQPHRFDDFIRRYGPPAGEVGPVRLAEEVFHYELDPWQIDLLLAYGAGEPGISVRACHGPGKTFIVSFCAIHQMFTRFPQHVVATAPAAHQIKGALLKELKLHLKLAPKVIQELFDAKTMDVKLKQAPEESWFSARTAAPHASASIQGVHCEGGYILVIVDEASEVHENIFQSAGGSMSGDDVTTILLSNPTRTTGTFYDTHTDLDEDWKTISIDAFHSSFVKASYPGRVARQYGINSDVYRVRVLGEFPRTGDDVVVGMGLLQNSIGRDIILPFDLPMVWALQLPRFGDENTVLLRRSDIHVVEPLIWETQDLLELVENMTEVWADTPMDDRPATIVCSAAGNGPAIASKLRKEGLPMRVVNVEELTSNDERFVDKWSQLWVDARNWLYTGDKQLPECPGGSCVTEEGKKNPFCVHRKLVKHIAAVRYSYSRGRLAVEPADKTKKRTLWTPELASAFVMSFAGRIARAVNSSRSMNTPLRRKLAVV